MMDYKIQRGTTGINIPVFIKNSTSAAGAGLTGLVYNTSGLTCSYLRSGDPSVTTVSLVSAGVGTYTSAGFIQVDAVKMPGVYQFSIPNAALSIGTTTMFVFAGAANMVTTTITISLDAVNYQDGVAFGLSKLANLANQGQTVALSNGAGGLVYNGHLSVAGAVANGVTVRCYNCQDAATPDTNAVVDFQTLVAQSTTDNAGSFQFFLNPSYYAFQYEIGTISYQSYVRWSTNSNSWITSGAPISTSQL